jgi:hypothetical protein
LLKRAICPAKEPIAAGVWQHRTAQALAFEVSSGDWHHSSLPEGSGTHFLHRMKLHFDLEQWLRTKLIHNFHPPSRNAVVL